MERFYRIFEKKNKFTVKSYGRSMLPILCHGDILSFRKVSFQDIKVNDLVIVRKKGDIITHRVIYKSLQDFIITKGDNNPAADGKIYPKGILGKVYQVKRNGRIFNPEDIYLVQSTQYFREIVKIKKALEEEGIDFVFLKGLPLHLFFEKSHPRRIYADCDVLIRRDDRLRADAILQKNGYSIGESAITGFLGKLKNRVTEIPYFKKIGDFPVIFDIHFDAITLINQFGELDNLFSIRMIEKLNTIFLNDKRPAKVQNEKFPILASSDLIIYSAYNIFHHNYRGIFRLEFLDKVIRRSINSKLRKKEERPGDIGEKINNYQLQNFVYPVFLLLKKYYHTPLSGKFLESIKPKDDKLKYIRNNILKINIFDDETRITAGVNRFKNLFFLSPNPLWKRVMIIFNIRVVYSALWVMIFFLRRSVRRSFKSS